MINIYAMKLWKLSLVSVCAMVAWCALAHYSGKNIKGKKTFRIISVLMMVLAIYAIFAYTVLNRKAGGVHQFVLVNQYNPEYFRELYMNGLLYLPLGLALSVFLGPWTILVAFLLSIGIEVWQYVAGTGLAQGTDVLMNTVGAAIGVIPVRINKYWRITEVDESESINYHIDLRSRTPK